MLMAGALSFGGGVHGAEVRIRLATIGTGVTLNANVTSVQELRERNVVIQRYDYSCGSAALATILRYHFNDVVNEQDIVTDMIARGDVQKIIERRGFSLLDMKRFAERQGYKAAGYRMSYEDLVAFDTPTIVPIVINDYRHFVVFKGANRDRVFLADPAYGNRSLPIDEFEQAWSDFDKVGLVITRDSSASDRSQLRADEADAVYVSNIHFQPLLRGMPSLFTHNPLSW